MRLKFLSLSFIAVVCAVSSLDAQNLTAEEILAKHLDSIGTTAKRQSLKNIFAAGFSGFEAKVPVAKGRGKMVVVSDPNNLYFLMSLNSREYPYEKVGMFGDKVSLPFSSAGNRSLLGAFLFEHSQILSENLFCGSMSMRWMSRISDTKKLKLKAAGMKKIDGNQTYVIDALGAASGTSDFTVRLYFSADTFRHVRTEYHREVQIGNVAFGKQNQLANGKLDLREEFSDFKEVDGLTLPYSYKVTFESNDGNQTYETQWFMHVQTYYLNQNLASDFFTFEMGEKPTDK